MATILPRMSPAVSLNEICIACAMKDLQRKNILQNCLTNEEDLRQALATFLKAAGPRGVPGKERCRTPLGRAAPFLGRLRLRMRVRDVCGAVGVGVRLDQE